ncbi:MAG: SRPBCC family protein [Bacteroidales bacterium]|nr:SRPBCC family protein [Bacteroidales bacterium]
MAFYQIRQEQFIQADLERVWDFISAPENLKKITPPSMGFDITGKSAEGKMYPGMIITYIVRPVLHIPTKWMTEITHVKPLKYFVDEQRIGPYKLWHHQHKIEARDGGVLMTDIVTYAPPFGILGRITNRLLIRKKLKEIFDYRFNALEEYFTQLNKRTSSGTL